MRKVLLGVAFIAFVIILVGISAQDFKTKKEAPKTEMSENETPKAETSKSLATCCSAPGAETVAMETCCNAPGAETAAMETSCGQAITCSMNDGKKDCCQVEKLIAEKKIEAKMKK